MKSFGCLLSLIFFVSGNQSGTYTGIFTPTSQGGDLLVDWIRVYDNGHTEVTVAECDSCDPPDNSGAVGNSILYRWFTSTLLTFMGLTSMASLFV